MTRLTNFLAALAPWCAVALAPIATAWQIYAALIAWLAFPPWVAFSAALALELLGMTAISLALTLRSYNATKRKDDPTAPMALPYVIIGGYFIVAELLTVALDPTLNRWTLARAVFPPFSLVAFGLAATMQDHAARVATITADKAADKAQRAKRKADSLLAKQPAVTNQKAAKMPQQEKPDWRKLPMEDKLLIKKMSTADVMRQYAVKERTASGWIKNARDNGFEGEAKE